MGLGVRSERTTSEEPSPGLLSGLADGWGGWGAPGLALGLGWSWFGAVWRGADGGLPGGFAPDGLFRGCGLVASRFGLLAPGACACGVLWLLTLLVGLVQEVLERFEPLGVGGVGVGWRLRVGVVGLLGGAAIGRVPGALGASFSPFSGGFRWSWPALSFRARRCRPGPERCLSRFPGLAVAALAAWLPRSAHWVSLSASDCSLGETGAITWMICRAVRTDWTGVPCCRGR